MADLVASNQQLAGDADDQDRLFGLLCYIFALIVPLIVLLSDMKNRPFRRFHAVNALGMDAVYAVLVVLLCCCSTVGGVVLSNANLGFVSLLGNCVFGILFLAVIGLRIWYAVLAYQGNYFDIPFLTNILRQQRWI